MPHCPNCGAEVPENHRFCGECGPQLGMVVLEVSESRARPTARKVALVVGGIAFLILVIAVIVVASLGSQVDRMGDIFAYATATAPP